jgi:hypothetical protein
LAKQWQQQAQDEASALLQPFFVSGLAVMFDAPKPLFRSPAFRCSDVFNAGNPICRGGLTQPRESLQKLRAPVVDNLTALANQWPQMHIWDPFPVLCPNDSCSAFEAGRPLFFDGDHLSAYGNARLYPAFRDVVLSTMSAKVRKP